MHVESRLQSTRLGDVPLHVVRFLALYVVIAVSLASAMFVVAMVPNGLVTLSIGWITTHLFYGGLYCWLPALVLTIAWRSSEVAHG